MFHIFKTKEALYATVGVIALLLLDYLLVAPYAVEGRSYTYEKLNENLETYTPVYITSAGKNLFNLRANYFYRPELTREADVKPEPRNISRNTFIGYAQPGTMLNIVCDAVDPAYKKDPFKQKVATMPLIPGIKEVLTPGIGSLSKLQVRLTVIIEEVEMDLMVSDPGLLWNSYGPTKAYKVTLEAKKIRTINVELDENFEWSVKK